MAASHDEAIEMFLSYVSRREQVKVKYSKKMITTSLCVCSGLGPVHTTACSHITAISHAGELNLLSRFLSGFRQHSAICLWLRHRHFPSSCRAVVTPALSLTLLRYPSLAGVRAPCVSPHGRLFVGGAGFEPAMSYAFFTACEALHHSGLFRSLCQALNRRTSTFAFDQSTKHPCVLSCQSVVRHSTTCGSIHTLLRCQFLNSSVAYHRLYLIPGISCMCGNGSVRASDTCCRLRQ